MTEKLKENINIPIWLFTILVSLFITVFSFTISLSVKAATLQEKVLKTEQIVNVKANQTDVDRIYTQLERIENKIDKIRSK